MNLVQHTLYVRRATVAFQTVDYQNNRPVMFGTPVEIHKIAVG